MDMAAATAGVLLALVALGVALAAMGVHKIDEMHVGVYFRNGALLNRITRPGLHVKMPLLDRHAQMQVTLQTDSVRNIPCGTSGGVMLTFERVEVVNRLNASAVYSIVSQYGVDYDKVWIFDKIHHELNQFCSKHTLQEIYIEKFHTVDDMLKDALQESVDQYAPGIQIIAVRVTKPSVPRAVMQNYEAMEAEKAKLQLAQQEQRVAEKRAETERKQAVIQAQKQADVSRIDMQKLIDERQAEKEMARIEDEKLLHHRKTLADAATYEAAQRAKSHELLLSPQYLALQQINAIANNTKVYFGDRLGSMFSMLELARDAMPALAKQQAPAAAAARAAATAAANEQ